MLVVTLQICSRTNGLDFDHPCPWKMKPQGKFCTHMYAHIVLRMTTKFIILRHNGYAKVSTGDNHLPRARGITMLG